MVPSWSSYLLESAGEGWNAQHYSVNFGLICFFQTREPESADVAAHDEADGLHEVALDEGCLELVVRHDDHEAGKDEKLKT